MASWYPAMMAPDIRAHIPTPGKPAPGLAGRVATPVFPDAAASVGNVEQEPPGEEPPGPTAAGPAALGTGAGDAGLPRRAVQYGP